VPTSILYQLNQIMELIVRTDPQSVLDVGVGFGKYGFLSREYLELWDGRKTYGDWKRRIDGIEVFERYLTPVHDYVYDRIYIGDALDVLPTIETTYDLVLLIDIVEHFEYEEAKRLLKECIRVGRNIIISTPRDILSGDETFGNPYQAHKFQWERRHFTELAACGGFGEMFITSNEHSLVVYIGERASWFRSHFRKAAVKRLFPFLVHPVRAAKRLVRR
jgi:SAM-dependent methyltransferase